jgi:branched-chain amino acid transport system permease protein
MSAPPAKPHRTVPAWPAAVAVVAALAAVPLVTQTYYLHLLTLTFVYGIMAMSLDLLVGYTGLSSLGHAAYFGAAGYAVGILSTRLGLAFWPTASLAVLLTTAIAAVFGLLAIRAVGAYFLIITLALGQIVWGLAFRWVSMTGGDNGLRGIRRPALGWGIDLGQIHAFYYFALAVTVAAAALMYLVTISPFGLSLRGIRESESRMRVLGYDVWLHKYLIFVLAGAFCGVGGVVYAYYNGFVSPSDVSLIASANALLMVILGGTGTLFGSVIGSALLVFLQNLLSGITQRWLTVLGAILVLAVMYAPAGIVGAVRLLVRRRGPGAVGAAGPAPAVER